MKFKEIQVIHSITALALGLFALLEPASIISFFGMFPGKEINLVAQFFGVELLAVGLICWNTRDMADKTSQKVIIKSLALASVFGVLVTLIGILSGILNLVGQIAGISLYGIFTLGYVYLLFSKPKKKLRAILLNFHFRIQKKPHAGRELPRMLFRDYPKILVRRR